MTSETDDLYANYEEIDFSKLYTVLRDVVLFDDTFLNMQAMNLALVDQHITQYEYGLLEEYLRIERTPTQSVMFVSALSQMWIFALYELLRTWRARVRKLLDGVSHGTLSNHIKSLDNQPLNLSARLQKNQAERALSDSVFADRIRDHWNALNGVFRMTEAIRINLAKHEIQGSKGPPPRSPGYGRINGLCGAIDFEVEDKDGALSMISRRDIADAIRNVEVP